MQPQPSRSAGDVGGRQLVHEQPPAVTAISEQTVVGPEDGLWSFAMPFDERALYQKPTVAFDGYGYIAVVNDEVRFYQYGHRTGLNGSPQALTVLTLCFTLCKAYH